MLGLTRAACVLALAAIGLAALPARADPAALLLKAADAARSANYRGTLIYRADGHLESLHITHGFSAGQERERLVALTGEPREIIRVENQVMCLLPKDRKLDFQRPALKGLLSQVSAESLRELSAWYDLQALGSARVAGRNCRGAALVPRDGYRYGFEVWADEVTGVPLRVALTGPGRKAIEEVMFTEVEFPASLPDSAFAPSLDPARFNAVARQEPALRPLTGPGADIGDFPVRFEGLPPGYRVLFREQRKGSAMPGTIDHVLLSDGLAAVSVFASESAAPDKAFTGHMQLGGVQAYQRWLGRYRLTVVGETPSLTVETIAKALRLAEEPKP